MAKTRASPVVYLVDKRGTGGSVGDSGLSKADFAYAGGLVCSSNTTPAGTTSFAFKVFEVGALRGT